MPESIDVLVYGGTSAGVCAAVAAADAGASVLLVEPGRHLGGMTSGGLGYTDVGDERALGGPAARLRADIAEHYAVPVRHYAGPEPHVAEQIFERWLERSGVRVEFGASLRSIAMRQGRDGAEVGELVFETGLTVSAGVVIDATYEGDAMAASGVPYRVGREDASL